MYKHLFALTALWASAAVASFPMLYLMVAFANTNPTLLVGIASVVILLFYFQSLVQSFIAMANLKRLKQPKQYLYAVLMIILAPLSLFVSIPIGMDISSNLFLWVAMGGVFAVQVFGSVWVWKLIATLEKKEIVDNVSMSVHTGEASAEAEHGSREKKVVTEEVVGSTSVDKPKRRTDIVFILLYAPVIVIVVSVIYIFAVAISNALLPGLNLLGIPVVRTISEGLGMLLALSPLASLVGVVLYFMRRKKK